MEGRAIARPDRGDRRNWPRPESGFNGGPGNCPAGRRVRAPAIVAAARFNGGPGNCPAGRHDNRGNVLNAHELQWRAGQLPGRTRRGRGCGRSLTRRFNGGPGNCPAGLDDGACRAGGRVASMEGRAIARPDGGWRRTAGRGRTGFNGGPGNCPAGPRSEAAPTARSDCFNGGPGNCPAGPLARFGALEVSIRGHLRAVWEALASKVRRLSCQAALCLVPQGVERSHGLARSP